MSSENALRQFLSSRRAAISQQQTRLPLTVGTPRARPAPEEVAALAGVSVAYYTKLEQGRTGGISDEVLATVRAPSSSTISNTCTCAPSSKMRPPGRPDDPPANIKARPALIAMIYALDPAPALIHGPHLNILAANDTAELLIDDATGATRSGSSGRSPGPAPTRRPAPAAGPPRSTRPNRSPTGSPNGWPRNRCAQQLAAALARLRPGDRDVLLLVAAGGFDYQEVALALGIPVGTVSSRLARARRKLREALGGVDPTDAQEDLRR